MPKLGKQNIIGRYLLLLTLLFSAEILFAQTDLVSQAKATLTSKSPGGLNRFTLLNQYKEAAEIAFQKADYLTAATYYQYLVDTLKAEDERLILNTGHSFFKLKKNKTATRYYESVVRSTSSTIRSSAWQQLGLINLGNPARSLRYFQNALEANPNNEVARYNYELLKLKNPGLSPETPNQKKQGNGKGQPKKGGGSGNNNNDQDKQGEKGQGGDTPTNSSPNGSDKQKRKQEDQKGKEGEGQVAQAGEDKADKDPTGKGASSKVDLAPLQKMNMTPQQAQQILDAMRNSEVQYIQQRKFDKSKKQHDLSKPDW